jgi:hypothetical protein
MSFTNYDPTNIQQTQYAIDNILQETALKVGCCKRTSYDDNSPQTAVVRVPIHPSVQSEYGFKYKEMNIPANQCPTYYYADSQLCNAFYDVYCQNIFNAFSETKLPPDQLLNYAPECACYIPNTEQQSYIPPGTPAACYKQGCSIANKDVYLDTVSRNNPCDIKICQNIFSAQNVHSNSSVTIDPVLKNTCSEYLNRSFLQQVIPIITDDIGIGTTNFYIVLIVIILLCFCSMSLIKKQKSKPKHFKH